MGQDPDQIRHEIEGTRADMGATLDEIEDRVSPRRVLANKRQRFTTRLQDARGRLMGTYDEAKPQQLRAQAQGHPLVAGAMAFGAGVLAASLLPPSKMEQQAAGALQEKAEPVGQQARQALADVGSQVGEDAREAKDELREQAKGSANAVKNEVQTVRGDEGA